MPVGPDFIRAARPDEVREISALLEAAFGRSDEAELVERLRADGDMWLECVMPWEGVIAGYAALSRMREPNNWACLAPVAVLPRFQRGAAAPDQSMRRTYAMGTRLVDVIAQAAKLAPEIRKSGRDVPETIVVLGSPSFYERVGFSAERARNLVSPYPIEATLIARPGDDVPSGTLVYPRAFESLG